MRIVDSLNFRHKPIVLSLLTVAVVILIGISTGSGDSGPETVTSLIGAEDSILVVDPQGSIIIAKNDTQKLIPASILKIFTSLVALHYLGPDHRFQTDFFFDNDANLKIKGYGDPRLTSEIVREISRLLAALIGKATIINDLSIEQRIELLRSA